MSQQKALKKLHSLGLKSISALQIAVYCREHRSLHQICDATDINYTVVNRITRAHANVFKRRSTGEKNPRAGNPQVKIQTKAAVVRLLAQCGLLNK